MKMDFNIQGLKCDNPNCDYVNPDIPFEEYENLINHPCPKCGQPLLTEKTYKMCLALKNMGNFITKITGGPKENDAELRIPLEMDKEGKIEVKTK